MSGSSMRWLRRPSALLGVLMAIAGSSLPARASAIAGSSLSARASAVAGSSVPARTSAVVPHTSLPTIERQVMCVTCKIPLNVAQSPQADRERAFIQSLIEEGQSEGQIKQALVGQYGPGVLGLPRAHGFALAAYIVPLVVVLALLATLVLLVPRWRRHTRARTAGGAPAPMPLPAGDAARLEADLARFD